MHKTELDGGRLVAFHNGDFSGNATLFVKTAARTLVPTGMSIPCSVFVEFAAKIVRARMIAAAENATAEELVFGDLPR